MAITSRFVPADEQWSIQDRYTLPEPIYKLFEKAPMFGKIFGRREFYDKVIPFFETYQVVHAGLPYSLRPAWTNFHASPRTHVIVIGHVLFCHTIAGMGWYPQPSVHLFTEDAKTRAVQLRILTERAIRRGAFYG